MANEAGRMDFTFKDESHRFSSFFCLAGVLRIKRGYLSRLESIAARR